MGYWIDILTDHEVLIEKFAKDKSVQRAIPQEHLEDDIITFIFPSNVSTLTSKFFQEYFKAELSRHKTKDTFNKQYRFMFLYPNHDITSLISKYIDHYYFFKGRE